jgi:diacylglycerol kinase family enzyme
MKKRMSLIVNPVSGGIDKTTLLSELSSFHKIKIMFITYQTSGTNDAQEIKALYDQHKPERIIIAGGDGTIKLV